jgi:hypothetical protein
LKDLAIKTVTNIYDTKTLRKRIIAKMSEEDRTHILNKIRDKESDKGLSFKFLRFNEWTLDYTHFLDRRLVYDHNFGREDYLITREFMYR